MADIDYMHSVNMMKAASPYLDIRTRRFVDFAAKILDIIFSFRALRQPLNVDDYEYKMDVEGLLTGIRPHCNDRERSIVDQILGIFNAKRMYETYTTYMNMMNAMQEFNNGDSENPSENGGSDFDFSSILGNNFGNFSVSDIQNFVKIFQSFNHPSTDSEEPENHAIDNYGSLPSDNGGSDDPDSKESEDASDPYDYDKGEVSPGHSDSVIEVDFSTGAKAGGKSSNPKEEGASYPEADSDTDKSDNSNVIDMLKTMIPPEQVRTFENLSMLFKAMSYDNTNKPNQK